MAEQPDPGGLRAGYAYARGKGVAAYLGVLRDGRDQEAWRCAHRPHFTPGLAAHCAETELEKRRQGAREVLHLLHCAPCGARYDIAGVSAAQLDALADGVCPQCTGPVSRERIIVLEREAVT